VTGCPSSSSCPAGSPLRLSSPLLRPPCDQLLQRRILQPLAPPHPLVLRPPTTSPLNPSIVGARCWPVTIPNPNSPNPPCHHHQQNPRHHRLPGHSAPSPPLSSIRSFNPKSRTDFSFVHSNSNRSHGDARPVALQSFRCSNKSHQRRTLLQLTRYL
jgi:hypothetical protein